MEGRRARKAVRGAHVCPPLSYQDIDTIYVAKGGRNHESGTAIKTLCVNAGAPVSEEHADGICSPRCRRKVQGRVVQYVRAIIIRIDAPAISV